MPASAMIAEHSEIIRKGMVQLLESSGLFGVVRETPCSASLIDQVRRHQPDILFVNPGMIDGSFREKLKKTQEHQTRMAAIVYSLHDESTLKVFDEVILVNDTRAKILRKLNALLKERVQEPANTDQSLTAREVDVLKLLVKGMSNKEISSGLFISTHTVMTHRKNITQKLNIKSVAGLTVYAMLNGLISMDELD
jgi:DNA-binding NarL/FixJ family response regulator